MTAPIEILDYEDDADETTPEEAGACCMRCWREDEAEQWLAARGGAA